MTYELSDDGVRRARVWAQLLHDTTAKSSMVDVVSTLVGVQAQDPGAAALAIRARSVGLVLDHVTAALAEQRSVVLTWSLRGTRHYHHRADVRWLAQLLGPVFARPGRRAQQLGIAGEIGDDAVGALRRALASEGPLTRGEVKERLAAHGVNPSGQAAIHVIRRAALEGLLCMLPGTDTEERYVLLDDWVEPAPPLEREEAAARLARRYLAAYGPATPQDFAAWSGLGMPVARQVWAAVVGELAPVEGRRGTQWVLTRNGRQLKGAAHEPAPLRLLGAFDTLVLGHADRRLLVGAEHARLLNSGGGMVKPTVLADGRVCGTWASRPGRRTRQIEVRPFRRMTPGERAALEAQTADIGRFLGTDTVLAHQEGRS